MSVESFLRSKALPPCLFQGLEERKSKQQLARRSHYCYLCCRCGLSVYCFFFVFEEEEEEVVEED